MCRVGVARVRELPEKDDLIVLEEGGEAGGALALPVRTGDHTAGVPAHPGST